MCVFVFMDSQNTSLEAQIDRKMPHSSNTKAIAFTLQSCMTVLGLTSVPVPRKYRFEKPDSPEAKQWSDIENSGGVDKMTKTSAQLELLRRWTTENLELQQHKEKSSSRGFMAD